jgi:hypothetical protein
MEVIERKDGFIVTGGKAILAGPYRDNAEAWRWLDNHSAADLEMIDAYNRIRVAFSER